MKHACFFPSPPTFISTPRPVTIVLYLRRGLAVLALDVTFSRCMHRFGVGPTPPPTYAAQLEVVSMPSDPSNTQECSSLECVSEKYRGSQAQEHTSVIPALRRLRPEDGKLKARLDYKVRPCPRTQTKGTLQHKPPSTKGFCTLLVFSAMAHPLPPSCLWRCGHQPYGSSKGQPDRESLCPHRKVLCVRLPITASDEATLEKSLPGNKHS